MSKQTLKLKSCYILDNIVYDCETEPVIETSKLQKHYYARICYYDHELNPGGCLTIYIVLKYEISPVILNNYIKLKKSNLPTDILELICNELFGYHNLDFLDAYNSRDRFDYLIRQYVLDDKCKFAVSDLFDLRKHTKEIINNNAKIKEFCITNSYDRGEIYKGMRKWITKPSELFLEYLFTP